MRGESTSSYLALRFLVSDTFILVGIEQAHRSPMVDGDRPYVKGQLDSNGMAEVLAAS